MSDNIQIVKTPVLIDTVAYSAFTASTTLTKTYRNVLDRKAKQRTFLVYSSLNQPVTSVTYTMTDTTLIALDASLSSGGGVSPSGSISDHGGFVHSSLESGLEVLASPVDSFTIGLAMGATVPTSGNFEIYLVEVL